VGEGKDRLGIEGTRIDPGTEQTGETPPRLGPEAEARRLEEKADSIRRNVSELVGELDHRRHRAVRRYLRPTLIGVAIAGVAALAALIWRSAGRRSYETASTKKLARVGLALRRAAAHPERVAADPAPSVGKRAATAAISLGSLIAGRLIRRHLRS
jgi:hypothetical protein